MNQTEHTETNSEQIRKIYAKDLKVGEAVHTVFRATDKEKHTSRGGKTYLTLQLVDRTGAVDGRVFENAAGADQAFNNDDYLLVRGKIGSFHGKTQIVIDQLERLDPGPIDANEFAWVAPVAPVKEAREHKAADDHKKADAHEKRVRLSKRLERLLENPQLAQALDTFVAHLEKALDAQRAGAPVTAPRPEKAEKKPRGPRHDKHHDKPVEKKADDAKPEPKRDPSLPEGLAFKPFNALVADAPAPETKETP